MKYAVYDTVESCWLGDNSGPRLFDDFTLARVAAQVWETQVYGTDLGAKYQARVYINGYYCKRDDVPTRMDAESALRRIEGEE